MDMQNFRTAMRGFHRDDVVQFIETQALNHEKELRAKNDEIAMLQGQLEERDAQLKAAQKQVADLEQQLEELTAPAEPLDAPIAPPADALPAAPSAQQLNELELTAYRRAELAERRANERAAEVYRRIQATFDASVTRLFEADHDLDTLTDTLLANLQQMKQAVNALCGAYQDTSASFRTIGTEGQNEKGGNLSD